MDSQRLEKISPGTAKPLSRKGIHQVASPTMWAASESVIDTTAQVDGLPADSPETRKSLRSGVLSAAMSVDEEGSGMMQQPLRLPPQLAIIS
jgi:hypothetical protein